MHTIKVSVGSEVTQPRTSRVEYTYRSSWGGGNKCCLMDPNGLNLAHHERIQPLIGNITRSESVVLL